jgi:hypothetical protein
MMSGEKKPEAIEEKPEARSQKPEVERCAVRASTVLPLPAEERGGLRGESRTVIRAVSIESSLRSNPSPIHHTAHPSPQPSPQWGEGVRLAIRLLAPGVWLLASFLLWPFSALATPTQEEVFKSINQNVGEATDPGKFMALIFGAAGVVILLVLFSHRRSRDVSPRSLNHQGKLLKEVVKRINLRPSEVRQLKVLAEEQQVSSPLTLLLCPSVLAKAVKHQSGKVDTRVIAQVARKMTSREA